MNQCGTCRFFGGATWVDRHGRWGECEWLSKPGGFHTAVYHKLPLATIVTDDDRDRITVTVNERFGCAEWEAAGDGVGV